jgi:hypothetical protein
VYFTRIEPLAVSSAKPERDLAHERQHPTMPRQGLRVHHDCADSERAHSASGPGKAFTIMSLARGFRFTAIAAAAQSVRTIRTDHD